MVYPISFDSFLKVGQYLAKCENKVKAQPHKQLKPKYLNTSIRKIIRSYRYKDKTTFTQNESY